MLDYELREAIQARREIIAEAVDQVRAPDALPSGFARGGSGFVALPFSSSTEDEDGNEVYQAFTEVGDETEMGLVTGGY